MVNKHGQCADRCMDIKSVRNVPTVTITTLTEHKLINLNLNGFICWLVHFIKTRLKQGTFHKETDHVTIAIPFETCVQYSLVF